MKTRVVGENGHTVHVEAGTPVTTYFGKALVSINDGKAATMAALGADQLDKLIAALVKARAAVQK